MTLTESWLKFYIKVYIYLPVNVRPSSQTGILATCSTDHKYNHISLTVIIIIYITAYN